jgi:hypothetical protein
MAMTSTAPQVLQTSGASAREQAHRSTGAWIPTGVVTADLYTSFQGTGAPFAGRDHAVAVTTPRPRNSSVSGIKTSGPPV